MATVLPRPPFRDETFVEGERAHGRTHVAAVGAKIDSRLLDHDLHEGVVDVSVVAEYWPGVDPVPQPVTEVESMHLFVVPMPTGVWCLYEVSGRYAHIVSSADITALQKSGATGPEPLSAAQHAVYLATFATPSNMAQLAPPCAGVSE